MKGKLKIAVVLVSILIGINAKSQNQAKLIVYRPGSAYGSLAHYKVNVDGREVATLKSKSMYQMDVAPGSHTVAPKQAKRGVTFNASAGQTYVVEYTTPIHILGARPKLHVRTWEEVKDDKRYKRIHDDKMKM